MTKRVNSWFCRVACCSGDELNAASLMILATSPRAICTGSLIVSTAAKRIVMPGRSRYCSIQTADTLCAPSSTAAMAAKSLASRCSAAIDSIVNPAATVWPGSLIGNDCGPIGTAFVHSSNCTTCRRNVSSGRLSHIDES